MKEKSETKDLAMTPKNRKWICVDGVWKYR